MAVLVAHGVVSRKRRTGTVIEQPAASIPGLWTVSFAYAPEDLGAVGFYTLMSAMVQTELLRRGFQVRLHPRQRHRQHVADTPEDFQGLAHDIAAGVCAGVLTPANVACGVSAVPWVHLGAARRMPCASLYDRSEWIREAIPALRAAGAARIHLVADFAPSAGAIPEEWWPAFVRAAPQQAVCHAAGRGLAGGMAVADQLLALPARQRPDGLVVTDDRIASGLSLRLLATADYRPTVAVQTCRQVPQVYGWPVLGFANDLEALIATAIDLLAARLVHPEQPAEQRVQVLQRTAGDEPAILQASRGGSHAPVR